MQIKEIEIVITVEDLDTQQETIGIEKQKEEWEKEEDWNMETNRTII